jgi:valyl-tRNA synthetase
LARYYPTSVLVTGFDIIFFWVARMMMMGLKCTGEVPFGTVVLHPLVRDAQGQKMSKSKGNVVDPLEILDSLGADAFRFALAAQAGQARDIKLDVRRVEGYSKFVNKVWNAARFTLATAGQVGAADGLPAAPKALPDRWVRSRLGSLAAQCRAALDEFHYDRYCEMAYQFTWYEFCDWYLELAKPILNGNDPKASAETAYWLRLTMGDLLKLLHPVMPFLTEELWGKLALKPGYLMDEPFPGEMAGENDPEAEKLILGLMDVTKAVRQARSDFGLKPSVRLSPVVLTADQGIRDLLSEHGQLLLRLMGAEKLSLASDYGERPKDSASNVLDWGQVWTPLAGLIDPKAEEARLGKEGEKLGKEIGAAKKKLSNPEYLGKAPEDIVEETRERLAAMEARLAAVERALSVVRDLG